MTCAEFQRVLPEIIDSGGNADQEAHLRDCPVCSDLVADLKYIADQAKLLVPILEPSPMVWAGIQSAMEREGLVRPTFGTARFPSPAAVMPRRWGLRIPLAALAAVLLVAIGVVTYRSPMPRPTAEVATASKSSLVPAASVVDDDDIQLLQQLSKRAPAMRATYEDNLKSVNQYIADARQELDKDPNSQDAHDHLNSAYDQKAMLYEMALSRSLE